MARRSVTANVVCGTPSEVEYRSVDTPPVIPSGLAELLAIRVNVVPLYL